MINYLKLSVGLLALAVVAAGCSDEKPTKSQPFELNANIDNQFDLVNLDYPDRPFFFETPMSLNLNFDHDENGVKLELINGEFQYAPYTLVNMGLQYLSSFYVTHDSAYLNLTFNYANRLNLLGTRINDCIYITYTYNGRLHGTYDVLMAPWFSGLTQGFALNLISRMYELTGDMRMRYFADSLFNTFLYWDTSAPIWTTAIDSAGYYWIEEYPYHPLDHVMGGFINALLGLHNYYLVTHDERCKTIFQAGCTTVVHYFDDFRDPGNLCYYCILHKHRNTPDYHVLDAFRLRQLYTVSGNPIFEACAESLDVDYAAWSDTTG
jgi:heparosan-N-sulfate-glucuronate 5-epimerase